jgi:hypothetical protein
VKFLRPERNRPGCTRATRPQDRCVDADRERQKLQEEVMRKLAALSSRNGRDAVLTVAGCILDQMPRDKVLGVRSALLRQTRHSEDLLDLIDGNLALRELLKPD